MLHAMLALCAALGSADARMYAVDASASSLTYDVVHKLHQVHGESRAVEGRALLGPDGALQVMVRVPVASFRSGDANRDEHMLEVVGAAAHPNVVFKATGHVDVPAALSATVSVPVRGEIELHGVRQAASFPVTVQFSEDGTVRARASFSTSLDGYGIERPSLLFVKIDDGCAIGVDFRLRRVGP